METRVLSSVRIWAAMAFPSMSLLLETVVVVVSGVASAALMVTTTVLVGVLVCL